MDNNDKLQSNMSAASLDVLKTHRNKGLFEEKARLSKLGFDDKASFEERLRDALINEIEGGGLTKLSPEAIKTVIDPGGTLNATQSAKNDPMAELIYIGALNAATFLNVGHFTGDTYMLRPGNDVVREKRNEGVEPVHETDGQMDG
jgi:hypothetical protein